MYVTVTSTVTTVQLTAKFTTRVVFSYVLFEASVKTHVLHVSEPIARVGLVNMSLECVREYFMCLNTK